MTTPEVLAVIVNHHGSAHTAQAARSILADDAGVHLVVVDNSESVDEAARLRAALPAAAELVVAARNLGFGNACNLAARRVPAPLVWLVNPDARVLPGCLAALRRVLDGEPRLGAVAPLQYLDAGCRWMFSPAWLPAPIDHWVRRRVQHDGRNRRRYDHAVRAESLRLWCAPAGGPALRQRALSGSNLLLRRACIDDPPGPFDPAFFMYFEDSDLCMRLRRRHWRLAVAPAARALHLWHLSTIKDHLMAQSLPVYRARHFDASVWPQRGLDAAAPAAGPEQAWPTWPAGPWPVPADWQSGWALEVSPTPLFSPSIGRLGQGPVLPWPDAAVAAMPGVRLYARLGPLQAGARPQCRVLG